MTRSAEFPQSAWVERSQCIQGIELQDKNLGLKRVSNANASVILLVTMSLTGQITSRWFMREAFMSCRG